MAVSKETSRQAIMTAIEALKATWGGSTLVVETDNRKIVNTATQTNPYLCVEILYINGYQASLKSTTTTHRVLGSIILTARVKSGGGVATANAILEHFYPTLQMTDALAPVRTEAAKLTRAKEVDGWAGECAVIPFWYDNQA